MSYEYTKIAPETINTMGLNAGIIVDTFNPATRVIGNILGTTSGGLNLEVSHSFKDFGEDLDNCPKNTMEFKNLDSTEVKVTGTFATITTLLLARLNLGAEIQYGLLHRSGTAGDADETFDLDYTYVTPTNEIKRSNTVDTFKAFNDLWVLTDYSGGNNTLTNAPAGVAGKPFYACKFINALSTGGFKVNTSDKDKMKLAFEFTAHGSILNPDQLPYEMYLCDCTGFPGATNVYWNNHPTYGSTQSSSNTGGTGNNGGTGG